MSVKIQSIKELEHEYVQKTYDDIADEFTQKRYKALPRVKEFLQSLPNNFLVADIGCGNGRYFDANTSISIIGCDKCETLVIAANTAVPSRAVVCLADNLQLPFRDSIFDAAISAAVIHHFATHERRLDAIREMIRILKPGGQLFISVWALEQQQRNFSAQDVLIPWMNRRLVKLQKSEDTQSIDSQTELDCANQLTFEDDAFHDAKSIVDSENNLNVATISGGDLAIESLLNQTHGIPKPHDLPLKKEISVQTSNPPASRNSVAGSLFSRIETFMPSIRRFTKSEFTELQKQEIHNDDSVLEGVPTPDSAKNFKQLKLKISSESSTEFTLKADLNNPTSVDDSIGHSLHAPTDRFARLAQFSPLLGRKMAALWGVNLEERIISDIANQLSDRVVAAGLQYYVQFKLPTITAKLNEARRSLNYVKDETGLREIPTAYRFYHVFKDGELASLIADIKNASIVSSCYDHANWCVIVEKSK